MWRKIALVVLAASFATGIASARQQGDDWGPPQGRGGMHGMYGHGPGMGGGFDGMGPGMFGMGRLMRGVPLEGALAEKLALNSAQREQIRGIKDRAKKEQIQLVADLRVAHLDLEEVLRDDPGKTSVVDGAMSKVSSAHNALLKSRVRSAAEQLALLTPAQRKTLDDYVPERPGKQPRSK